MADETTDQERRSTPRRDVDFIAMLRVGVIMQGRGHALNISLNGVMIKTFNFFSYINPRKVPELIGTPIKIVFPIEDLSVVGEIVRINYRKGEVAIAVKEATRPRTWKKLCEAQQSPPAG